MHHQKEHPLIDVDSRIANLPLMKLSAYHEQQGHNVYLQRGLLITNTIDKPNLVYISCIFTWNKSAARKLAKQFPDAEVQIGGSGVSLSTRLPEEVEILPPDYDLYPEIDYSLGYCVRGCPRSCGFCIIPKKDGKPRAFADIYDFWDSRHKKIVILDDNILALPDHFKKIANQIIKEKLKVEFHSLDIRFLDDEIAALLKQMHVIEPHFAWDDIRDEYAVMRGIEILRRNGINRSIFYILIGFNSTWEEDLYRANRLRDLGQRAFIMVYNKEILKDRRYFHLRGWTNGHMIFGSTTFEEYIKDKL